MQVEEANNSKERINKTSYLALKHNDSYIRQARKWLQQQLFYTSNSTTKTLITLSRDNIVNYHELTSNETIA